MSFCVHAVKTASRVSGTRCDPSRPLQAVSGKMTQIWQKGGRIGRNSIKTSVRLSAQDGSWS